MKEGILDRAFFEHTISFVLKLVPFNFTVDCGCWQRLSRRMFDSEQKCHTSHLSAITVLTEKHLQISGVKGVSVLPGVSGSLSYVKLEFITVAVWTWRAPRVASQFGFFMSSPISLRSFDSFDLNSLGSQTSRRVLVESSASAVSHSKHRCRQQEIQDYSYFVQHI